MYGLEDNANNLIVMHREVLSCWLLLADDLKLLSDNQSLLQSQMEAQATLAREEEGLLGAEVQALAQRITSFLNDMPAAEAQIVTLEAAKATLEAKNEALTSSVSSLTEQLETTLGIVLALRDIASGCGPMDPLDLTSST
jgi:septal ring factor EnvC (AmiA/AmiB activator)